MMGGSLGPYSRYDVDTKLAQSLYCTFVVHQHLMVVDLPVLTVCAACVDDTYTYLQ